MKAQHAAPRKKEDAVRNPMTWWKKIFNCRMMTHTLSKRHDFSLTPNSLFLIFFNYCKRLIYPSPNLITTKNTNWKYKIGPKESLNKIWN
jgi:hypothetical protein